MRYTFEIPDVERWGAAFEELVKHGIGVKAQSGGRLTVSLDPAVDPAAAKRLVNGWIRDNLARKLERAERRRRRSLRRVEQSDLEVILGTKRQLRGRPAAGR